MPGTSMIFNVLLGFIKFVCSEELFTLSMGIQHSRSILCVSADQISTLKIVTFSLINDVVVVRWQDKNVKEAMEETEGKSSMVHWGK